MISANAVSVVYPMFRNDSIRALGLGEEFIKYKQFTLSTFGIDATDYTYHF